MPSSNASSSAWTEASTEALSMLKYLTASVTPYHAVQEARTILDKAGFSALSERDSWKASVKPGSKFYVTRGNSSIIAFALPKEFTPKRGFSIVGAHTDSCCFIVRPSSRKASEGYDRVGVEAYGGGNWHTWLDRDLGIAGVVTTKSTSDPAKHHHHLVQIDRPILRIPSVAIHLEREQNIKMAYQKETQLVPILALVSNELNGAPTEKKSDLKHSPILMQLLTDHLSIASAEDIVDFDLRLYDTHKPSLGGANQEFILSARIDNLYSSYCAVESLAQAEFKGETGHMIALWDHEECGSMSNIGAMSNFLETCIGRIVGCIKEGDSDEEAVHRCIANSFLISADMGHAIHPSWPEKHEANARPQMNQGPIIKTHKNQCYATSNESVALLRKVAAKAKVPLQDFVARNDLPCGSTIGPIAAVNGLRTIDIGCGQLSMHSIRETAGSHDVAHYINLMRTLHEEYAVLDEEAVLQI